MSLVPRGAEGLSMARRTSDPEALEDYLTNKFRFEPRQSEATIMSRIETQVADLTGPLFAEAQHILDRLYESVRTFDIAEGGEKAYRRYADGRYVEDWSRLDKHLAEETIWGLQRVILRLSQTVTDFEVRMKFAYTVWDDEFQEHYQSPVEGTIQDRTAYGRRQSKDARYYYLYTWIIYRAVADRVDDLKETRRMLEFQMQRGGAPSMPRQRLREVSRNPYD